MATKKSSTVRPERSGRAAAAESKGDTDLPKVLADLSAQVAALTERLAKLEGAAPAPAPAAATPAPAPQAAPAAAPPPEITEEELLAVSAALAAYFGVRMRIRQIRLLGSQAWAQQGRVSIQASHRLHN
jgi:methylmalonyl-CoA carboxyltransferase large subunit